MNVNILFAVFMAVLLVMSVFQTMQIASIKSELKIRVTGSPLATSSSSSQSSTGYSGGSGMVGGC